MTQEALLEREEELAVLERALDSAIGGLGAFVFVEGPAGIGKTRLLAEARERGRQRGMRVLTARATELEREFPFGVVRQLVDPVLAVANEAERDDLLAGAAALVRPLVSELAASGTPSPTADWGFPVLHGLYWLAVNVAERSPLAIVVDDLHWTDAPSLRFLAFLAPRLEELPVALVVATRIGEEGGNAELLAALASEPGAIVLRPRPISEDAVTAVLAARLGEEPENAFASACHEAVGGNPLLLDQLVGELRREAVVPSAANSHRVVEMGPRAVSRWILARLGGLDRSVFALARAAAVLGEDSEYQDAASLAGLDSRTAVQAADELVRVGVIRRTERVSFVHPIVRCAVYEDIAPRARAEAHKEAARLLAARHVPLERLAAHLLATDPSEDAWVVETLRSAARDALGRSAPEVAVDYLRRALAEPPPGASDAAVRLELGVAEQQTGDAASVDHLTASAERSAEPVERSEALRELSRSLLFTGRPKEAFAALEEAIAAAAEVDPDRALGLEAELVAAAQIAMPQAAAERLSGLERPVAGDTPGERMLLGTLALDAVKRNRPAHEVIALGRRALGAEGAVEEPLSGPSVAAAMALVFAEDYDWLGAYLERLIVDSRLRGSVVLFAVVSHQRARLAYREGRLVDAEAEAQNAISAEGLRGPYARFMPPLAAGQLAEIMVERGNVRGASEELRRAGLEQAEREELLSLPVYARGIVRVARGEPELGRDDLLGAGGRIPEPPSVLPWRSRAALAHLALGEREAAQRLVADELELARAFGAPRALGIALRAAGLVEGGDEGLELLRAAVSVLEDSPARLEHARALTDLGAALRRHNRRSAAREPLRHGLDMALRCGAPVLAESARTELAATGARPRRLMLSGVDALTGSELRVAKMVASGMSNREVAQALFVTMKTVEAHLGHAYQKLGIHSRAELPRALEGSNVARAVTA